MDTAELSSGDLELFGAANELLLRRHDPQLHQVAAALRAPSGAVYMGLHIGSRRLNVCAESSAIANAAIAGEENVSAIIAVCMDGNGRVIVTNPCGFCRELLGTYGPAASVIVDLGGVVRKVAAADLMPHPWLFPHETEWDVEDPHTGASPA